MVTGLRTRRRCGGWMVAEVIVALAILGAVVLPLSFSFMREVSLCRAYYYRAAAMEVVDGEMELLVAGEHRRFAVGIHPYEVRGATAEGLAGRLQLTVGEDRLVLEWIPEEPGRGGGVRREVLL